jgi:hypothetical protein
MTARTRAAALAGTIALAATLTLAACGGEPEPEPTPTEEDGPLATLLLDYLGDWSGEDITRQLARAEERIAECMAEQGFEYTPVDYTALDLDLTGDDLGLDWGSKEFAEQYGYGITTNPLLGEDAEAPPDPNAEYVAAMSPSERDAYDTALYGEHYAETMEPDGLEAGYDWQERGCTGRAQQELIAGDEGQDDQFSALQEDLVTMLAAIDADPRLNQVNADWSVCMADAGYPDLDQVGDADTALTAEVAALQEAPPDVAALDELTAREIDTAVADAECRDEVGYDAARRAVDTEYQFAFLAEHREEIQSWMESLTATRSAD